MHRIPLVTALALVLSACGGDSEPADDVTSEATPDASQDAPAPTPSEPVSIIRSDIEEAVMIPLEPLELTVSFGEEADELTDAAKAELQAMLESRQVEEGGAITLRGHSDAGGNDTVNMRVSEQRAETVKAWLVEQGIAEDRISTIAFGEQNPVEPNALPDGTPNEPGRAANRRVEITVAAAEGVMVESPTVPADKPSGGPEG